MPLPSPVGTQKSCVHGTEACSVTCSDVGEKAGSDGCQVLPNVDTLVDAIPLACLVWTELWKCCCQELH